MATGQQHLIYDNWSIEFFESAYRLQQAGEKCDVNLISGTTKLCIHSLILAAHSPVFLSEWNSSPDDVFCLDLSDYADDIVRAFVEYLYTGNLKFDASWVESMLELAAALKLKSLENVIVNWIQSVGLLSAAENGTDVSKEELIGVTQNIIDVSQEGDHQSIQNVPQTIQRAPQNNHAVPQHVSNSLINTCVVPQYNQGVSQNNHLIPLNSSNTAANIQAVPQSIRDVDQPQNVHLQGRISLPGELLSDTKQDVPQTAFTEACVSDTDMEISVSRDIDCIDSELDQPNVSAPTTPEPLEMQDNVEIASHSIISSGIVNSQNANTENHIDQLSTAIVEVTPCEDGNTDVDSAQTDGDVTKAISDQIASDVTEIHSDPQYFVYDAPDETGFTLVAPVAGDQKQVSVIECDDISTSSKIEETYQDSERLITSSNGKATSDRTPQFIYTQSESKETHIDVLVIEPTDSSLQVHPRTIPPTLEKVKLKKQKQRMKRSLATKYDTIDAVKTEDTDIVQEETSSEDSKSAAVDTTLGTSTAPEFTDEAYKCVECAIAFSNLSFFDKHVRTHHGVKTSGSYKCHVCTYSSNSQTNIKDHLVTHTELRPHSCDECGKTYRFSKALRTHMLDHTGIRPFKCDVCDKAFKQQSHLKYHTQTHSDEKPFTCEECGKSFRRNTQLKVHHTMHTEEKKYQCPTCKLWYRNKQSIAQHEKKHAAENVHLLCKVCGVTFLKNARFKDHMKTHGRS